MHDLPLGPSDGAALRILRAEQLAKAFEDAGELGGWVMERVVMMHVVLSPQYDAVRETVGGEDVAARVCIGCVRRQLVGVEGGQEGRSDGIEFRSPD